MKTETTFLKIVRLTVTLLVICAAMAAVLAGVNAITKEPIANSKMQKTEAAIQQVLPGASNLEVLPLTGDTGIVKTVYASEAGYAVEVVPAGFGGGITMMVGIADGKVTGISVISHAETPGLGAVAAATNAKGNAFRVQFEGLTGGIFVGEGDNGITAISGATITSKAVVNGVNAALEYVQNLG